MTTTASPVEATQAIKQRANIINNSTDPGRSSRLSSISMEEEEDTRDNKDLIRMAAEPLHTRTDPEEAATTKGQSDSVTLRLGRIPSELDDLIEEEGEPDDDVLFADNVNPLTKVTTTKNPTRTSLPHYPDEGLGSLRVPVLRANSDPLSAPPPPPPLSRPTQSAPLSLPAPCADRRRTSSEGLSESHPPRQSDAGLSVLPPLKQATIRPPRHSDAGFFHNRTTTTDGITPFRRSAPVRSKVPIDETSRSQDLWKPSVVPPLGAVDESRAHDTMEEASSTDDVSRGTVDDESTFHDLREEEAFLHLQSSLRHSKMQALSFMSDSDATVVHSNVTKGRTTTSITEEVNEVEPPQLLGLPPPPRTTRTFDFPAALDVVEGSSSKETTTTTTPPQQEEDSSRLVQPQEDEDSCSLTGKSKTPWFKRKKGGKKHKSPVGKTDAEDATRRGDEQKDPSAALPQDDEGSKTTTAKSKTPWHKRKKGTKKQTTTKDKQEKEERHAVPQDEASSSAGGKSKPWYKGRGPRRHPRCARQLETNASHR